MWSNLFLALQHGKWNTSFLVKEESSQQEGLISFLYVQMGCGVVDFEPMTMHMVSSTSSTMRRVE